MDARRRIRAVALAATSAALIAAAPASAAYAPQFSFKLDPATADTAATIVSTITQAPGESASKTVTVTLPAGFTPNPGSKLYGVDVKNANFRIKQWSTVGVNPAGGQLDCRQLTITVCYIEPATGSGAGALAFCEI